MITFLIILGVIFGIIALALLSTVSVSFYFSTGEKARLKLKVMGISVISDKPKAAKKSKKKSKPKVKKQPTPQENILQQIDFKRLITFIFSEELGLFGKIKYVLNKTVFTRLKLKVVSAGEDAAQTAIMHGSISALLYPVVGFLETVTTIKSNDISVYCDFEGTTPSLTIDTVFKIRIYHLLKTAIKILKPIKNFVKDAENNE